MHEDYLGQKLCIFISKNDKYEGIVLYELLLEIAFNSRLSGGTVTIGDKGFFGTQDESTRLKILRSSENLPVVLEFQGRTKRIDRYIKRIQPMIKEGLFTRADVLITKFNSPTSETNDFEELENEDQSQIFREDVDGAENPDPQPQSQDFAAAEDEDDAISSAQEGQDDPFNDPEDNDAGRAEFLEPDKDQTTAEDTGDLSEAHIDIPLSDDDDIEPILESKDTDQQETLEGEVNDVPDPPIERASFIGVDGDEDESDASGFHSLDDKPSVDESVDDTAEAESDSILDDEHAEDTHVLQLTDLSETQVDESGEDSLEKEDPHKPAEDTSSGTEFAESHSEEYLDELFEESNEKHENTLDDMLKQAGEASVVEPDLDAEDGKTLDKEHGESPSDETSESTKAKSRIYDKNHTEEDMINYFSSLFKKSD